MRQQEILVSIRATTLISECQHSAGIVSLRDCSDNKLIQSAGSCALSAGDVKPIESNYFQDLKENALSRRLFGCMPLYWSLPVLAHACVESCKQGEHTSLHLHVPIRLRLLTTELSSK